ncbi:Uncharacterised protein [uncultured archaeon]|nr:Uncharacterised protein [uncultured archaeon]
MKKMLLSMLLAFAALSVAHAQPAGQFTFPSVFTTYAGIAVALLAISIFLAAAVYMLGNFLSNEKMKVWAKGEAVEIFYSGVILAMALGLVAMADSVAEEFTRTIDTYGASVVCNSAIPAFNTFTLDGKPIDPGYATLPCHIRVAKNFLASLFYETAGFLKAVGVTHSWYTFLSSFTIDYTPVGTTTFFSGAGFNHGVFAYLNAKNNGLSFLFDNGVKVLTILRFQEILMNFIAVALFPLMLMAGIILRSFMLTRKLGGLLMALALSLYFIYPMFYVLGDSVYNGVIAAQHYDSSLPPEQRSALARVFVDLDAAPPKMNDTYKENYTVNVNGSNVTITLLNQLAVLTAAQQCQQTLDDVNSRSNLLNDNSILPAFGTNNTLLGNWLSDAFKKGGTWDPVSNSMSFQSILTGIDVLAKALFFSLFFSFLSIFATLASVKALSPIFGGDVEIAGLTHLI